MPFSGYPVTNPARQPFSRSRSLRSSKHSQVDWVESPTNGHWYGVDYSQPKFWMGHNDIAIERHFGRVSPRFRSRPS